jgi:hypothetical protein
MMSREENKKIGIDFLRARLKVLLRADKRFWVHTGHKQAEAITELLRILDNPPQDLWAECVAMLEKYIEISVSLCGGVLIYELINYEVDGTPETFDLKTLEELHAKLTELTKG